MGPVGTAWAMPMPSSNQTESTPTSEVSVGAATQNTLQSALPAAPPLTPPVSALPDSLAETSVLQKPGAGPSVPLTPIELIRSARQEVERLEASLGVGLQPAFFEHYLRTRRDLTVLIEQSVAEKGEEEAAQTGQAFTRFNDVIHHLGRIFNGQDGFLAQAAALDALTGFLSGKSSDLFGRFQTLHQNYVETGPSPNLNRQTQQVLHELHQRKGDLEALALLLINIDNEETLIPQNLLEVIERETTQESLPLETMKGRVISAVALYAREHRIELNDPIKNYVQYLTNVALSQFLEGRFPGASDSAVPRGMP